jgi:pyruvate,water dikinase
MDQHARTSNEWPADNPPSAQWPIYTRGNIGEVLPNVQLPFEWAMGGVNGEKGWRLACERIGFVRPGDYGPGDLVLIGVFGGYAYFNASIMRLLGVRTPGMSPEMIDEQFLGEARVDGGVAPYTPRPGDRNLLATINIVRTVVRTLRATTVPAIDEMRARVDRLRAAAPPLDGSDTALLQYVQLGYGDHWTETMTDHVAVTLQATMASGRLTDLCQKHLDDPNLAVTLTTGIGDVVSAQPAREIWHLANETPAEEFDEALAAFLERHGHRGPNEFSLSGRDWASHPNLVLAAVDAMRGVDPDRSPVRQAERMAEQRQEALAEVRSKVGGRRAKAIEAAIESTALWSRAREAAKNELIRGVQLPRQCFMELVRRAASRGGVGDHIGPLLLSLPEFESYLADPSTMSATIESRRTQQAFLSDLEPPFAFDTSATGAPPPLSTWPQRQTDGEAATVGTILTGAAGAPGVVRGRARVITDPADPRGLQPGDVLVAPLTDPAWTPLFVPAAGVVVEVGAAMSHSMIVSRELGIPCVVGVEGATQRLADGVELEIDGQAGTVTVLG